MHIPDLKSRARFSSAGPDRNVLFESPQLKSVLISLKAGQEIPPHKTPSEIVMYVVSGRGIFHIGDQEGEVSTGNLTVCGANVDHGIKAHEEMVVLVGKVPGN